MARTLRSGSREMRTNCSCEGNGPTNCINSSARQRASAASFGIVGHGRDLRVPLRAELLLDRGNSLAGKGAIELWLTDRRLDALAEVGHCRGHATVPHDAIDAPFGVAAAGAEIKPTIRPDRQPGHIERLAFEKDAGRGSVTGAGRLEPDVENPPLRPIADEQRIVIAARIHHMVVGHHARRRAAPRVGDRRQAIEKVTRPDGPSAAPAILAPRHDVQQRASADTREAPRPTPCRIRA